MVQKNTHEERNFKFRGVLTSSISQKESQSQAVSKGFEKAVFKIHLDKTGLENPDKWETCMLLNDKLAKPSNNVLFLNAMVTAEQWYFNENEGYHIFDVTKDYRT